MLPIFSNIEEILPVNKQLLQYLEEKWENWSANQTIGEVLLAITPFLKVSNIKKKISNNNFVADVHQLHCRLFSWLASTERM